MSPSKTLASFLAVFCFGVFLGAFFPLFQTSTGFLLVLVSIGLGYFLRHKQARFVCFLLAAFFLGVFRYQQAILPSSVITVSDKTGVSTRVEGIISREVEEHESSQRVVLDHVRVADTDVEGKLLVQLPFYPVVRYGDTIVFNCALEKPEPFNGFAYDQYLATQGIYALCTFPQYVDVIPAEHTSMIAIILKVKASLLEHLNRVVPEPEASFLSGLLFGGGSSLSTDLKNDFSRTGTSHILAASGFNVSLFSLIFLSWILQTPFGRKRGLILTAVLLFLYTITAGATPAVVRAAIMGLLVLVEKWISRKALMLNVVLLAATFILLVNPLLLLGDVGFQLSFVATVGLLVYTKPLAARLTFIPDFLGFRESFSASLAALVVTLPILILQFGQISLVAPIANLLILPFVPYVMAFGFMGIIGSFFFVPIGMLLALPAWALSFIQLWVLTSLSSINIALISVEHSSMVAFASLVCVVELEKLRHHYVHS